MRINRELFLKNLPEKYSEIFSKGLIHNWTVEACADKFNFPPRVGIVDTTLRDGEQQPGVFFTPEQKVDIVKGLAEAKIDAAEIGYPAVSEEEMRACRMIAKEKVGILTFVMARAKKSDIDAAVQADAKAVDLFTSSSEFHIRYKLKITPEENIRMYLEALDYAKDHGLLIAFGREDCSRAHIPYLVEIIKKAKEVAGNRWGGTAISDTTGSLTPSATQWLVSTLRKEMPNIPFGLHCHNDFGMATANTLAGIEAGASGATGTLMGIGERAGNAPIEEIVLALRVLYGIRLSVKIDKLYEVCKMVSKYSGIPIPVQKPIIGANAFKHESGIHAAGVLAHPLIYEPIPAELLGRTTTYWFGKFSGSAVVESTLRSKGIEPTREQLNEIVQRIKDIQTKQNKQEFEKFVEEYDRVMGRMGLNDDEIVAIAKKVMGK